MWCDYCDSTDDVAYVEPEKHSGLSIGFNLCARCRRVGAWPKLSQARRIERSHSKKDA